MLQTVDKEWKDEGFTPRSVARNLNSKKEREKPQRRRATPSVNVFVDVERLFKGVVEVVSYFERRQRRKVEKRERELEELALRLAGTYKGIVGMPDLLMREACDRDEGERCFRRLMARGDCLFLCEYEGESVYVFPAHLARVWHCSHCDSSFPSQPHQSGDERLNCCNCGGTLEQQIAGN